MGSQQLDEEAIFEVASAISDPALQAKYLRRVCHDERLLGRLEGRLRYGRRRWQFSLRTLIAVMLLAGAMPAVIAATALQAARASHDETIARMRAVEAQRVAKIALDEAEAASRRAAELEIIKDAIRE